LRIRRRPTWFPARHRRPFSLALTKLAVDTTHASPDRPRLPLSTEADIERALANELFGENHFLELKREVKPGKGENRDTARDLASFAVDGGTVIVGLEEQDDGSVTPYPQPPRRLGRAAGTGRGHDPRPRAQHR
jgi:hypothetical protein